MIERHPQQWEPWLNLATRAAQSAGPAVMSGFRSPDLTFERKPDGSYVTPFDREAERLIRGVLETESANTWPVLGEEYGGDIKGADYYWIIDPIDGTTAFVRGLPHFGTLLALDDAKTKRAVLGVMHLPEYGETYTAARGLGARCNGAPARVAADREWKDRVISIPALRTFERAGLAEGYRKLNEQGAHLRGNADCSMHGMVARGFCDVCVEFGLRRWDVAVAEVLIEEAGGRVLLRKSISADDQVDMMIGSPEALEETAALIGF